MLKKLAKIKILPDYIVNKIAAGEVVERPASVVKELVENSLDAGAKKITVTLKVGGKSLIKIVDDGCGMSSDDALTALERHATSKIKDEKDLEGISSLGFRGEALPSIAAVSRMTIITRSKEEQGGVSINIERGKIRKVKEIGAPVGTSIEIANLFFNVPARKKFLKTTATELSHITRILTNVALSRPGLRLHVEHNDRKLIHAPSASNLQERIAQLFGSHIRSEMTPVDYSIDSYHISGLILKPAHARAGKSEQIIFVNQRPVKNRIVTRAAYEAYSSLLEKGRHPGWIIFIEMDPQDVDVNVHPAKSEVRFANQGRIFSLVRDGVLTALGHADLSVKSKQFTPKETAHRHPIATYRKEVPDMSRKESETIRKMVADYVSTQKDGQESPQAVMPPVATQQTPAVRPAPPEEVDFAPPGEVEQAKTDVEIPVGAKRDSISGWVPIGQFHDSYLVCQSRDELILIDQHAAHERVLFDKILHELENRAISSQRLLFPVPVELTPAQTVAMEDYSDCFSELGFTLDNFGQNTFMVKEVPAFLGQEDVVLLIKDILAELSQAGHALSISQVKEKIAASSACKGAVKANQKLKLEEIRSLLNQMEKVSNPYCCPHGRPCVVKYPLSTLKKDFHRS